MAEERDPQFFTNLHNDYAAWSSQIVLCALYEEISSRKAIPFPDLLEHTTNGVVIPDRILDSQKILHELATKMLDDAEKPSKSGMEEFFVTLESFQSSILKIEHNQLLAGFGIDELTGLFTHEKMIPDLERELERRSRRGQPFCFVVSRIDGHENRTNTANVLLAAKAVQKTIRSFDDAYVSSAGDFVSSLKHSDNNGGLKFIARLNHVLKRNEDVHFTMSSIVAEPMPGDSIPQLIESVSKELQGLTVGEEGIAEQFEEISPLSQYLKTLKDKT